VSVQGRRDAESIEVHERRDPRGNPYYWIGFRTMSGTPPRNSDLGVVQAGGISVTPNDSPEASSMNVTSTFELNHAIRLRVYFYC